MSPCEAYAEHGLFFFSKYTIKNYLTSQGKMRHIYDNILDKCPFLAEYL